MDRLFKAVLKFSKLFLQTSACDFKSDLIDVMPCLFSFLLISILLIQKDVFLLLVGTLVSCSRFFIGWSLGFDFTYLFVCVCVLRSF